MTKKSVKVTKKSVKIQEKKSALRMPGFNAEASLYTSSAAYHLSGASGGRSGGVELAFFKVAELSATETPIAYNVASACGAADIQALAASNDCYCNSLTLEQVNS